MHWIFGSSSQVGNCVSSLTFKSLKTQRCCLSGNRGLQSGSRHVTDKTSDKMSVKLEKMGAEGQLSQMRKHNEGSTRGSFPPWRDFPKECGMKRANDCEMGQ